MLRRGLLLSMLSVLVIASCRDATQTLLVLRTNVPYAEGTELAVWATRTGTMAAPVVEASSPWLSDGEVGDVVVVPGEASSESKLTVRVAMGLRGKRAAACTDDGDSRGCIVARRKLSFVPHTRLKVPIVMYLACEGVVCGEDSTCGHLGLCVPAAVDPSLCASTEGCTLPGEPPFVPGASGPFLPEASVSSEAGPDGVAPDGGTFGLELSAGGGHTCVRFEDGTVKCWGSGGIGRLGLGDTQDRGDDPGEMGAALPALALGTGRRALQIATGAAHTCARLDDGTLKCWGWNNFGQLGRGDTQDRGGSPGDMGDGLPALDLGPGRSVVQVSAGSSHTCARLDNGTVKCWGRNHLGQLGLGDAQDRGDAPGEMGVNLPAVDFGAGRSAVEIHASFLHTCARLDDSTVRCWGYASGGRLGLGDLLHRGDGPGEMGANLPAVNLGPGRTALQVGAGEAHTCARLDDGSVKCWGYNLYSVLGAGDTQERGGSQTHMGANLLAVNLGPGRAALQIFAAATGQHVCARLDDGTLKCWGDNSKGQLGFGDLQSRGGSPAHMGASLPALDLGPGRRALKVSLGSQHSCALLDDGAIKCWGLNAAGALGLGDTQDRGDAPGEMGANLPPVRLN